MGQERFDRSPTNIELYLIKTFWFLFLPLTNIAACQADRNWATDSQIEVAEDSLREIIFDPAMQPYISIDKEIPGNWQKSKKRLHARLQWLNTLSDFLDGGFAVSHMDISIGIEPRREIVRGNAGVFQGEITFRLESPDVKGKCKGRSKGILLSEDREEIAWYKESQITLEENILSATCEFRWVDPPNAEKDEVSQDSTSEAPSAVGDVAPPDKRVRRDSRRKRRRKR